MNNKPYPKLLTIEEKKDLLEQAEWLWEDLEKDDLGGYGGKNRPFYIVYKFREIIERFGHRDVGLNWSKNDLDAASVSISITQWRPIETAPKDGTKILAYYPLYCGHRNFQIVIHWCGWGNGIWQNSASGGNIMNHEPTHWIPLSEPPREI